MVGINFIAVGLVIALVPWVVDEYGIQCGRSTEDNAVHGVGLRFRM